MKVIIEIKTNSLNFEKDLEGIIKTMEDLQKKHPYVFNESVEVILRS